MPGRVFVERACEQSQTKEPHLHIVVGQCDDAALGNSEELADEFHVLPFGHVSGHCPATD